MDLSLVEAPKLSARDILMIPVLIAQREPMVLLLVYVLLVLWVKLNLLLGKQPALHVLLGHSPMSLVPPLATPSSLVTLFLSQEQVLQLLVSQVPSTLLLELPNVRIVPLVIIKTKLAKLVARPVQLVNSLPRKVVPAALCVPEVHSPLLPDQLNALLVSKTHSKTPMVKAHAKLAAPFNAMEMVVLPLH
jgi:hypothetical protein